MRKGTNILFSAVLAAAFLTPAAEAQERRSIVGKWSTAAGKCIRPTSLIWIGPQSLEGEDFVCDLPSVSRRGDVVTFRGRCRWGGDEPKRETLVARLAGERLYYRVLSEKGENGPFMRCPPDAGR